MQLPFFYIENFDASAKTVILDEDTSRHMISVLRMKEEEQINLTDGKGSLITSEIINANKKHCEVKIVDLRFTSEPARKISIAISLIKNTNRFEWFLEKATEIGVSEIIPLICERTEKQKFRYDRMKGICISAMLQSQQTWLPILHEPIQFSKMTADKYLDSKRLIAHCIEGNKQSISDLQIDKLTNCQISIGPEGDFTKEEIDLALRKNFIPVTLGETRLRTETAGVVAAALLTLSKIF